MKFRPLHDRVVVRRISENEKTAGGIIIPDSAQEKPQDYRDLMVKVAGYNAYFTHLDRELQDTIIARTAHGL